MLLKASVNAKTEVDKDQCLTAGTFTKRNHVLYYGVKNCFRDLPYLCRILRLEQSRSAVTGASPQQAANVETLPTAGRHCWQRAEHTR